VEKLPGVGHATREALARLNIQTIGALRALPRGSLQQMFGAHGLILFDRCRGRDTAAVTEKEVPKTISRETAFHRETDAPAEVEAMLYYLVERAARTMRSLGLACRRVEARLRYSDYRAETGGVTLLDAASDDTRLFDEALALTRRLWTRRASLRFVGVTLSRFQRASQRQSTLFDQPADARRHRLCACLDELRARFGHAAIVAGKSVELLGKLRQDSYGYVLRTPCLAK